MTLSFLTNFSIVAHEDRLHRAALWAEKSDTKPSSDPIVQPQPPEEVPTIPSLPVSDTPPVSQPDTIPTVPSPSVLSPVSQPTTQVPTAPTPPIVQPPVSAQVPTVLSPVHFTQPMAQVPTIPSPPFVQLPSSAQVPTIPSAVSQPTTQVPTAPTPPMVQPPASAQVPTVPSPVHFTQPMAQAPTIPPPPFVQPLVQVPISPNQASFPGFPNLTQTFTSTSNSDFNTNPQQSLMDLMSESYYGSSQAQQGFEDQNLFDFSGLLNFSGGNNFNSDGSNHDINVRLVLQASSFRVYRF